MSEPTREKWPINRIVLEPRNNQWFQIDEGFPPPFQEELVVMLAEDFDALIADMRARIGDK